MCKNWTQQQKNIYEGLGSIGGEIASYFKSALIHYYDTSLPSRVSNVANAAREIDGGLRDMLSPLALKEQIDESLVERVMDKLFGGETENIKGHVSSILVALDADEDDSLAHEWIDVATKFAKYAHRHGGWKDERQFDEFKDLWERYELVLSRLVGSFYKIIERIDRLMELPIVPEASCGTLLNLLKISTYERYAFANLQNLRWFAPLKDKGVFNPNHIEYDKNNNASFWPALNYLERVSLQIRDKPDENCSYTAELIQVIDDTFKYSKKRAKDVGKLINHSHVWWQCIKIINNIPNSIIKEELPVDKFTEWLCDLSNIAGANDLALHEVSEKLLRKFVDDAETIEYAEAIIDVVTGVKENDSDRPTIGSKDALLVMDSYWLMKAFEDRSGVVAEKCSSDAILGIADKLRTALEYGRKECHVNLDISGKNYQIKVARVLTDGLQPGEINYEASKYECAVGQYSQKQTKSVEGQGGDFALHYLVPQKELKRYSIEADDCEEMKMAVERGLPEKIKWHSAEKFTDNLKYLYEGLFEDYSHIWLKFLASEGMRAMYDAKETLTSIFRDVLLARCETRGNEAQDMLKALLSDQYRFPLFKRITLLCIDRYWSDYADLFQQFIDQERNVLREDGWEVELHNLLRSHCKDLSDKHKKRLRELIDDIPDYYREKGAKYEGHWKYKWLSPLKDSSDFSAAYAEAKKRAEIKGDEPYIPDESVFRGGFSGQNSPLTVEEILGKDISELCKFLKEFKGADEWGAMEGKPDEEGMANTLQTAAQKDPVKFTTGLDAFLDVPYIYSCRMLRGFKEAWNEKKDLEWEMIFEFCLKYLGKKDFLEIALKSQGEDSGGGKYIYFIEAIADLIEAGSRSDERAFDTKHFPSVDKIFDAIHPFLKGEKHPDTQRDALTYALNTTFGRVVNSFIIYSLRVVRVEKKTGTKRGESWGTAKYERYLNKGIEGYIWLGRYLPNVRYIDREYIEGMVETLSKRPSNDNKWRMFMEGYLSGAYVYDDVYKLMRPNCTKAVQDIVFDESIDKRLVEHITIGYLRGHESLNERNEDGSESLFRKMLDEAKTLERRKRWLVVPSYFWSISSRTVNEKRYDLEKKKIEQSTKQRVIEFWKWTYDERSRIETFLGDDYADFLGKLADLTIYLDKIDSESGNRLLLSSPHAEKHHMSNFLVEYLTKFEDDESLRWIGKIFVKMLGNTTPIFRKEDIGCIIRRLYKLGKREPVVKDYADKICNTYGRRGEHFLRDLFDEYNP